MQPGGPDHLGVAMCHDSKVAGFWCSVSLRMSLRPSACALMSGGSVSDLDAAIPLYEELAQARAEKFSFRDVELARVGPALLLAGNTAAYRDRTASIQVATLVPVLAALESAGGEVIEGPAPAPNGPRLIARHPDGAVFEYIETGEAE